MKILITGAGGFLGEGLIQALEKNNTLRLMDVVSFESPHEVFCGDVCNADDVAKAVEGMDAVVIAHMAPNRPEVYATPELPCSINITGTAMLDKYGKGNPPVNWQFIDRRDIDSAAEAALNVPDLACEVFYISGHPDAKNHIDVAYTKERTGWIPEHTFSEHSAD